MHSIIIVAATLPLNVDDGTGITGWFNGVLADLKALGVGASLVLAIVIFLVAAVRARGALSAILMAGFAAGVIIWLATGGIGWVGNELKEETNNKKGAPAPVHLVDSPDHHNEAAQLPARRSVT